MIYHLYWRNIGMMKQKQGKREQGEWPHSGRGVTDRQVLCLYRLSSIRYIYDHTPLAVKGLSTVLRIELVQGLNLIIAPWDHSTLP